jgi:hypothetical protein
MAVAAMLGGTPTIDPIGADQVVGVLALVLGEPGWKGEQ